MITVSFFLLKHWLHFPATHTTPEMGSNQSREAFKPRKQVVEWHIVFPQPWGLSRLINEGGLPPVTEPDAQCWFAPLNGHSKLIMIKRHQYNITDLPPDRTVVRWRTCAACGARQAFVLNREAGDSDTMKVCSGCKNVHYCDDKCRDLHWFVHKAVCRK